LKNIQVKYFDKFGSKRDQVGSKVDPYLIKTDLND